MPPTNRARFARERAGLSIGQAAEHLGIERDRLELIEESDAAFAETKLADMAEAYGVCIEWLTGAAERYDYAGIAKMKGAEKLSFHDRDILAEFAASMPRTSRTLTEFQARRGDLKAMPEGGVSAPITSRPHTIVYAAPVPQRVAKSSDTDAEDDIEE